MDANEKKPHLEVANITLLSQNPLSCNMCGKIFLTRRELLVHQWSHKERQNFHCPNCDKNFNNENQFKRHMHVHTREGKKYVTCDICKKVFRNNRTLEEHHVKDHTGQKPYRCGICGIQFSWRENLKKHLHTHIVKPFACMICHESFRDSEALDLHSKIHKREMKELEKREQERREQEDRERRRELHKQMGVFSLPTPHHTSDSSDFKLKEEELEEDERGFKCTVCMLSFKYQFTLEAHMKGHIEERIDGVKKEDGEVEEEEEKPVVPIVLPAPKIATNPIFDKPHTCEICKQSFRWAFCLDAHVKIHKQGYDAKEEKEKERKALKTAKERRRQDAIKKALAQQQQQVFGPEIEESKPEGTTVIVLEHFSEEEKQVTSELSELGMKTVAKVVKRVVKQAVILPNVAKPNRKRTRREAMAEQLTLEGREPDDLLKDHEVEIAFDDFEDGEIESISSKNNDSEEEVSGIDLKTPRLELPLVRCEPPHVRVRGGAKTRGGQGRISNHIDLSAMVANIGKESRLNLSIKRGGIRARGGSSHSNSNRPMPQDQLEQQVKEEESEVDSEIGEEEAVSEELDSGSEQQDGEDESMDAGSEARSEYENEEDGEVMMDNEDVNDGEGSEEGNDADVRSEEGDSDSEQSGVEDHSEQEEEQRQSESGGSEYGDQRDVSDEEEEGEEIEQEEKGSGLDESGEEEDQESEGEYVEENQAEEECQEGNEVGEGGDGYKDEEEQDAESGQVYEGEDEGDLEDESGDDEDESGDDDDDDDDEDEDNVSHMSQQVNEAAQTMLGLDESSDDEFDDDDDLIDDDVDEQELLKLKMKVYSCELCSKAFVQADLLMDHKVNYHQQNGDAVRNILNTKIPKVSPHTKVVSGPRSHSTMHRKSR